VERIMPTTPQASRHRERVSRAIPATPDAVFSLITDPARLPSWNAAITEVVDAPDTMEVGSVWRVRFRVFGQTWVSRSEVTELDPAAGRFGYRSQTDDGNPSYADWRWHIRPDGLWPERDRSVVTVNVALHPLTFGRKHVLVRVRRPMLGREVHHSLRVLADVAGTAHMYMPPLTPMI
jgi:uncharacterized protein YndB with AHSA1/START domain